MAIIYTYPTKATLANDDLVLISDSADGNKTKQVKASTFPGFTGTGMESLGVSGSAQSGANQTLASNNSFITISSATNTHTWDINGALPTANGGTGLTSIGTKYQRLQVNSGATALEYADATVTEVVKNGTTSIIAKGTPVYISGVSGSTPTIAPADATDAAAMPVVGLAAEDISASGPGTVMITGLLEGINTSSINDPDAIGAEGEIVYVSNTPATTLGLTYKKPIGPYLIQNVGIVVKYSAGTSGSIQVSCIGRTNDLPNLATGSIWAGDGDGVPEALAPGSANTLLKSNGSTISWGAPVVDLAANVGATVLPVANGGTGASSLPSTITNSTVNYSSDGTGALPYDHGGTGSSTAPNNQILIGRTTAWELSGASTSAMIIPVGDDSQRPVGVIGMLRLNDQVPANPQLEYYNGTTWVQITP
jgi:hypothetical protein